MVLFDLNNARGNTPAVAGHTGHASAFQPDVLASVKAVKRLSAHPWPFPVKSDVSCHGSESARRERIASSFVT